MLDTTEEKTEINNDIVNWNLVQLVNQKTDTNNCTFTYTFEDIPNLSFYNPLSYQCHLILLIDNELSLNGKESNVEITYYKMKDDIKIDINEEKTLVKDNGLKKEEEKTDSLNVKYTARYIHNQDDNDLDAYEIHWMDNKKKIIRIMKEPINYNWVQFKKRTIRNYNNIKTSGYWQIIDINEKNYIVRLDHLRLIFQLINDPEICNYSVKHSTTIRYIIYKFYININATKYVL